MARIESETLKKLLRRALGTRSHSVDCETCFDKLDQFVEMELDGKDGAQAFPLIKSHLESCRGCTEEYQALLTAVEQLESGTTPFA